MAYRLLPATKLLTLERYPTNPVSRVILSMDEFCIGWIKPNTIFRLCYWDIWHSRVVFCTLLYNLDTVTGGEIRRAVNVGRYAPLMRFLHSYKKVKRKWYQKAYLTNSRKRIGVASGSIFQMTEHKQSEES